LLLLVESVDEGLLIVPVPLVELLLEPVFGCVAVPESVLVLELLSLGLVVVLGVVVVFASDDLPVLGLPLSLGLVVDGLPGVVLSVPVPLVCA
jgi:hypothetical protein